MIALSGDRTMLLRVFARRVSPCDDGIVVGSPADLPSAEIVALFSDSPRCGELPHTIVVAKSQLREFFAWAATYLGHWSPLTARVRVIRRTDFSDLHIGSGAKMELSLDVTRGMASLILGEALCEWGLAGEKSTPTVLSLRSTFGHAALQALKAGRVDMGAMFDAWDRAQRALQLPPRRIQRSQFLGVWQPIVSFFSASEKTAFDHGEVSSIIAELIRTERIPTVPVHQSETLFSRAESEPVSRRREDVVVELENWLARRSVGRPVEKLYTACLAGRLSSAALSHFDVLAKMTQMEPETLLWYSFISGFLASEPSGQNVERTLFKLSAECEIDVRNQSCDISLDELEVLVQPDGHLPPWIGIGAGFIEVELKSGVSASFRFRDRPSNSAAAQRREAEISDGPATFDALLEQLRKLYHRRAAVVPKRRRRK